MLLSLLLPIFTLGLIGWLLARFNYLNAGWDAALSELVGKLLIPALLFIGAYRDGLSPAVGLHGLLSFFLPVAMLFLLMLHWGRSRGWPKSAAFSAIYANNVFVGLPVLAQALGQPALPYAFAVIAFHSLFTFSIYGIALHWRQPAGGLRVTIGSTLKHPIVASLLLGLVLHYSAWQLPTLMTQSLSLLSQAALPCALLALGASLTRFHTALRTVVLAPVLIKLLAQPALVFLACRFSQLSGLPAQVLVLLAACPIGINAYGASVQEVDSQAHVGASILISTMLCLLTIPCWIWLGAKLL